MWAMENRNVVCWNGWENKLVDNIDLIHPHTGRKITLEIKDEEWEEGEEYYITTKDFVLCHAYIFCFTKNKKTGEIQIVLFEENETA